jgi:cell division protein ZapA
MPELTVEINGREYQVACDDGQEEHLTKLARYVDTKMGELVGAVGQIGDARLLVMTGLLIADELSGSNPSTPRPATMENRRTPP